MQNSIQSTFYCLLRVINDLIESFRSPFTVNGNGEKRHKVLRDTLDGQRLR